MCREIGAKAAACDVESNTMATDAFMFIFCENVWLAWSFWFMAQRLKIFLCIVTHLHLACTIDICLPHRFGFDTKDTTAPVLNREGGGEEKSGEKPII